MPWWLRNEHTRAWVQPLPRPVGLPARLRSRAICRSGISRANSRTQRYVTFFQLKDGKIQHYREYWSPLITMEAMGGYDAYMRALHPDRVDA